MKKAFLSAGLAGLLSIPATGFAQPAGVTEVAPGVRVIDGSKVAVLSLSGAAIRQAVADNPKFSAIKKMLGSEGITNPGPQGTITHMYKLRDTDDEQDKVLILFVKGGKVLDLLLT